MIPNPAARVVVVDDDPDFLEAAAAILRRKYDVVGTATTGSGAVELSRRLDPEVIVLDIAMPGLDGFQAAAQIRKAGSNARIVFLSNYAGEEYVLASISQGASGFVAKPRMERDLLTAIDHAQAGRTFIPSAGALPRWRQRSSRRHDLQLYATDAFLVDAVVTFFENALDAGDSIVAVASEPHRHAFDQELHARGLDVDALIAAGRYSRADAATTLDAILRDGMPDRDRFVTLLDPILERGLAAASSSPPHVTMFGEIAPILCANGQFEAMLRLEQIADQAAVSRPMSILCGYPTDCLHDDGTELMAHVCGKHAVIVSPAAI
jgi:DNA-binding NarL/FixJ family response regulator